MSAGTIRRAATGLFEEWSGGNEPMGTAWHRERDLHLAIACWLEECATDYGKGYGTPDAHALAVARAYLGEQP